MNNNRITIISPSDKRKKQRYTIIMFILLVIILFVSCLIGYSYFNNQNHPVIIVEETTTTTTGVLNHNNPGGGDHGGGANMVTTTVNTNYMETNNYIYNYSLIDGDYKVYVCNGDYVSRLTNYTIYNKDNELGIASNINYLIITKDKIDLTNKPSLTISVNGKKNNAKYDGRC